MDLANAKALSDAELIASLKEGNHTAFTEIYNRNWKFLYNSAYNILRHHQDTLDVCQSIFIWFWENRTQIVIKTNTRGYLFTAVKYKVANLIRDGKVRGSLFENVKFENIASKEFLELEVKELKNLIEQLITQLPPKCREVFLMSRGEDLTHREIAERLGISERTVDEHISKALKKLRVPLGKLASAIFLI